MEKKKLSVFLAVMLMAIVGSFAAKADGSANTAKYTVIRYTPELEAAAEAGDAEAQYVLGRSLKDGRGIEKNEAEAVKWYQKAAAQNNPMAMRSLGISYQFGQGGLEKDMTKANEYYAKAISGLQQLVANNNGLAVCILGIMYDNGNGTTKDNEKAFTYYQKAAELGDAEGAMRLGTAYFLGSGTNKDLQKSFQWFSKSANSGDILGMHYLAFLYEEGIGTAQDYQKAIQWHTKAANAGNSDSMWSLGYMYDNGIGTPKDKKKGVQWYTKAANAGNSNAMNNLGIYYCNIAKDYKKAQYWLKKALAADPNNQEKKSNLRFVEDKLNREEQTNQLYAKYGKEIVDAYFDGRIVVGMPLELVNALTTTILLNGSKVSGNANKYVIRYAPSFHATGERSEVYYITFNAKTNKVIAYETYWEYL